MTTKLPEAQVDWVRAYNDLHWLLTLERAARDLGLSKELKNLLEDLYGRARPVW